jgi:hypothetical protein
MSVSAFAQWFAGASSTPTSTNTASGVMHP